MVRILRESYPDFGPALAAEKLQQRHGITVAKKTIRRVQIDAGLWIPRKLARQSRHAVLEAAEPSEAASKQRFNPRPRSVRCAAG